MAQITLEAVFEKQFSQRSFREKLIIIGQRPTPEMPNLVMQHKGKKASTSSDYTRHFSVTQYGKTTWLTGCPNKNKLFCWPCLLFQSESNKSVWSSEGFSDLNHLSLAIQKHERSRNHATNFLKITLFGKEIIDEDKRASIQLHNQQVKNNREVLKRLIQTTCLLGKQELPFQGHNELSESLNKGNFLEFLEAMREFDPILDNHFQTATIFCGTSATIQNDIVGAVASVLTDEIKKEIDNADFVSIMLDETSDVINKSQLSTVFRYVFQGITFERFIQFTDISADRSPEGLFHHIKNIVDSLKIEKKIIGYTCDGASVMAGNLHGLKIKVLEKYPQAHFTHCYAHVLNLLLQQSVNNIQECHIFFQTLNGLAAFFNKSAKRIQLLQDFSDGKLANGAPTNWNFTSKLIHTVKENRTKLSEFFSHCLENSADWDHDSNIKFQGFLALLKRLDMIFLLELMSKLFSYADVLYDTLQTTTFDVLYCSTNVTDTLSAFQSIRDNLFEELWECTQNQISENYVHIKEEEEPLPKRKKSDDSILQKSSTRFLFFKVIDNVCTQISHRFHSIEKLDYFNLLNCEKFNEFKYKFPDTEFNYLKILYNNVFDFIRLKNELIVVYSSSEFKNMAVHELVNFMYTNNLNISLIEVYKLGVLILTIPVTRPSTEISFSALKRIKSYNCSTQTEDRLSGLSVIAIEKNILNKLLENKNHFYESVINKFLAQERRIDFIYK